MKFAKKVEHIKAGASRAQFDKLALINAIIETVSTRNKITWVKTEKDALETLISPFGTPKLNEFRNAKPAGDDGKKYESKHFAYAIKALNGDFDFMEVYLVQLQKWSSEGKPISPIGVYLKSVNIPVASEVPVVAPVVAPVVRQSARIASQAAQNAPQVPQAPMLNAPLIRVEEVAPVEEFEEFVEEIAPVEEAPVEEVAPRQRRKKTREPGSLSAEALEMLETGRLIVDGPGSDDLKLKQLHSVERDFLKGTSKVPQYLEAFFKAKQKLENELGKPLIFGGGLRTMFIDRKLADDFTKAATKKVVKLEGSLAEKELTLAEQMEKIKKEDDEKNAISEFLDAESKKPSHARDSELISKLKRAGFMMKKAVVVDKLSAVPDRILTCYANLPLVAPVVRGNKYETRELFSMMKSKSKLKVHVTIPFVNGEPDDAYREVYDLIKPLANNQVPDSVFVALKNIGVRVTKESNGTDLIYTLSEVSEFDGIVYDDSIVSLDVTRQLTTADVLDEETKFDEKVDKEVLEDLKAVTVVDKLGEEILSPKGEDVSEKLIKMIKEKHDLIPYLRGKETDDLGETVLKTTVEELDPKLTVEQLKKLITTPSVTRVIKGITGEWKEDLYKELESLQDVSIIALLSNAVDITNSSDAEKLFTFVTKVNYPATEGTNQFNQVKEFKSFILGDAKSKKILKELLKKQEDVRKTNAVVVNYKKKIDSLSKEDAIDLLELFKKWGNLKDDVEGVTVISKKFGKDSVQHQQASRQNKLLQNKFGFSVAGLGKRWQTFLGDLELEQQKDLQSYIEKKLQQQ